MCFMYDYFCVYCIFVAIWGEGDSENLQKYIGLKPFQSTDISKSSMFSRKITVSLSW